MMKKKNAWEMILREIFLPPSKNQEGKRAENPHLFYYQERQDGSKSSLPRHITRVKIDIKHFRDGEENLDLQKMRKNKFLSRWH
jgi:hypothetical protein